jgi:3-oxoacyl-[acyl-carrier-protein] synthase-1
MFDCMGALSTKRNNDPTKASRAFDKDRDGFVIAGTHLLLSVCALLRFS